MSKDKIILSPEITLIEELKDLYNTKDGNSLLQTIYYMHSRDMDNPFRDMDYAVKEENVFMAIVKKKSLKELKLDKKTFELYRKAENRFLEMNQTAESRLSEAIDRKLDEISRLLNDTIPAIEESVTKSGEVKFTSNLNIILNLFSKIDIIMKARGTLETAILKNESKGRLRGGGSSSFRERGIFK
jgi:hypothetical protein